MFEQVQVFAGMEARAKGVVLAVEPGQPGLAIHADPHTTTSALSNLLQNAIKFTPKGGHVSLSVHGTGERIRIDVADECGGLCTKQPEELFQPFVQGHSDQAGLGIGLSISKRGVEANGGTIAVRNMPGTGCVFTIDLPAA